MITVHRRLSKQWVKLGNDEDAEFLLKPLSPPTMIDVHNELEVDEGNQVRLTGRGIFIACRSGIVDWKGVTNENGDLLPFRKDNIEWLPADCLAQLSALIVKASTLTEPERKNS